MVAAAAREAHDPYFGGDEGVEKALDLIEAGGDEFLNRPDREKR